MDADHPELEALRRKLEQEEEAYASLLGQLDALARWPPPFAGEGDLARRINDSWSAPEPPAGGLLGGTRRVWDAMAPALERQVQFNSALVQLLNGHLEEAARMRAHLAQLVSTLVQYLQRVLPVMDTRDRVAAGLATTRAELILEAFDRRQEAASRRLEGLLAMRDRLDALSEEMRALRGGVLPAGGPASPGPAVAADAADGALYIAFENAFRGSRDDIRERLRDYVPLFAGSSPVADLGCGRGEFLELLREAGIEGRGVEGNAHAASACRAAGLDVAHGDLLEYLRGQPNGALGGVFAAQVAEHLPPAILQAMLRETHRALRAGGILVLETVNPSSAAGFFDVYIRDLTHERPLHPDTLRFLAAAHGFTDVRIELRSPVDAASRLRPIPAGGLPGPAADALNENIARLNDVLFAPREYALIARR